MGTSTIIGVFLFFTFSSSAFSKLGYLSDYWFHENLEKSVQKDDLYSIKNFLKDYASAHENMGESHQKSLKNHNWIFSGFQTSLAVGLKGRIGIHSWGGTKTLEIDWTKRNEIGLKKRNENNHKDKLKRGNIFLVDDKTTDELIESRIHFILSNIKNSGRVKKISNLKSRLKKTILSFQNFGESISFYKFKGWIPSKIRLDLGIKSNGKIVFGPLVKLGADIRVRLEWKKIRSPLSRGEKPLNKNFSSFFRELDTILTTSLPLIKTSPHYSLTHIEVGLGVGVKGKIGLAEIGGNSTPSVFFKKSPTSNFSLTNKSLQGSFPILIKANNEKGYSKNSTRILNLDKKRIKRGIKKAFKFSIKFMDKLNKKIHPKSKWKINKIKSQFQFSQGGPLGPVKVSQAPHIAFYMKNNAK